MRKIILGWLLLALAMLGTSAVVGQIFNGLFPSAPEYDSYRPAPVARAVAAPPGPGPVRDEVLRRPPTSFSEPVAPDALELDELTRPIKAVSETLAQPAPDWSDPFDCRRMAEEEISLGFYRLRNAPATEQAVDAAGESIRQELEALHARQPHPLPKGVVQVIRVGWSDDRQEALVVARHTAQQGPQKVVQYVRWWLTFGLGAWRIYDFEFPDTRLRFLAVRNYLFQRPARDTGLEGGGLQNRTDVGVFHTLTAGLQWLAYADGSPNDPALASAQEAERAFHDNDQIAAVVAARKAFQQRLAALSGRPNAAETYARLVQTNWRDTPYSTLAGATGYNAQKKYAEALKAVKQLRAAVGDDPEAYREEAKAQAGLKNDPKVGLAVIQKGLQEFPGDPGLLLELARRSPAAEREAVGELIAKTATAEVLSTAAAIFEKQPALLDALCTGFLRVAPTDNTARMQAVHVKMVLGQFAAAAERLKAIRAADAAAWPKFETRLLIDDRIEERSADYYQVFVLIDEAESGYRLLAARHMDVGWFDSATPAMKRQMKSLEALNAAHAAKYPADPELGLWKATLLFARGDPAKAEAELATAMAKLKKPTSPERVVIDPEKAVAEREAGWNAYRHLRTRCLLKLGKWKQAYAELSPAMETFDQLAIAFENDRDEFSLGELVELHAKQHPNDPELPYWRGEVQFLKKNYEAALKSFSEIYNRKAVNQAPIDFRVRDRLIRTYLRLNRPADAKAVVDHTQGLQEVLGPELLYRALIAVAATEPDDLLEILDQHAGLTAALYADPDGQSLATKPEFARVRQKYPPPVR